MMEQHENRFFRFRLFLRYTDIQGQTVLALTVMLYDRTLMLDLYGRCAIIYRLKYVIRWRKRFGCFPSQVPNRRLRIGDPQIIDRFLISFSYIDSGFRLYSNVGIIGACDRLILFVRIVNVFFFQIKYIAFASE